MEMEKKTIEQLVSEFGEKRRRLITSVVGWLEEHEPDWQLEKPIDRSRMIKELLRRTVRGGWIKDHPVR